MSATASTPATDTCKRESSRVRDQALHAQIQLHAAAQVLRGLCSLDDACANGADPLGFAASLWMIGSEMSSPSLQDLSTITPSISTAQRQKPKPPRPPVVKAIFKVKGKIPQPRGRPPHDEHGNKKIWDGKDGGWLSKAQYLSSVTTK